MVNISMTRHEDVYRGRDRVKSLRSCYTGLYPQSGGHLVEGEHFHDAERGLVLLLLHHSQA